MHLRGKIHIPYSRLPRLILDIGHDPAPDSRRPFGGRYEKLHHLDGRVKSEKVALGVLRISDDATVTPRDDNSGFPVCKYAVERLTQRLGSDREPVTPIAHERREFPEIILIKLINFNHTIPHDVMY